MIRICSALIMVFMLAACSPDYNWRQVSLADNTVTAFFPDRTVTQSRTLVFDGHELEFSLTSAVVGEASFTVAHAALPEALRNDATRRQAFGQAVLQSLYRNLGVEPPGSLPEPGQTFLIEGQAPDRGLRLKARFWLSEQALTEALVTASPRDFPDNQADEFLRGVSAVAR